MQIDHHYKKFCKIWLHFSNSQKNGFLKFIFLCKLLQKMLCSICRLFWLKKINRLHRCTPTGISQIRRRNHKPYDSNYVQSAFIFSYLSCVVGGALTIGLNPIWPILHSRVKLHQNKHLRLHFDPMKTLQLQLDPMKTLQCKWKHCSNN